MKKNIIKNKPNSDIEGETRFDRLIKSNRKWRDECIKLTIHRQEQLKEIYDLYGGNKIPFSHFTSELSNNMALRNRLVYPAVCAYICSILRKSDGGLIKPSGLQWGMRVLTNKDCLW